ncbi:MULTISPECIES: cytochrome ubiquinol oxidase subunit I [Microbacterium]|jgi:cytochrome d ubiquinol oxidase subunit I|uniref:Cytochrome ubiquinol oxidase subunit I n=1 Tax=Microbacterium maritypicum TaxID=33918 RepID=A0A4Y4B8E0_MICMQ|nr:MULTISPECIES: cytochrome ubiquinol oxidase subunit I [Microbacterium]AZS48533.1 Cytochrome bd ubiquinol oxidase subunit 1 [Microbacterium oxydans]KAB1886264.1 cytochrome ubiquinol oxidase subunit I [Microbacterium liquefaciens]KQV02336.1 cytochrome BD ubiquinol oxidase subunit I [Microbacterium sp. Root322]KQY77812.1 cytochrome BD ubiquinol oxidase subunit I [Microbacterium sp. Root1433D1]MBP5801143.1 cytochrome ubiquinol oxidase subunit I [Microbacterium liquefaciens]
MEWLDPLALARWQFGLTTVYHYLFVPLTIGMALVAAIFQTAWVRTAKVQYLHLTRFFGKIFLINFAMGVVTGIVQEFQFGMNWSDYSRFVGDVFGAPLAFEGLLAFFFEATFIGLWIFGWDKLPQKLHLATIWCVSIGSILSAYFIIAANAFMQNPVGYTFNEATNRAELTDFWALLTNPVALAAFPHTIFGAFMFAAGVVISVSAWHLSRGQHFDTMRISLKFGLWAMIVSTAGVVLTGDQLGLAMYAAQPMKMAAAEATFNTVCGPDASFSIFTLGTPDGSSELFSIRVPYLLSLLSTHTLDACVHGINDLNAEYAQTYASTGLTDFAPILWITYWAFRWMIGLGIAAALVAVAGLWVTRKGAKKPVAPWMWKVAIWSFPLALAANIMGWVFTEMGRQPWIVFGLMTTQDGVSPGVSGLEVLISLISFTAIYAALAVVEIRLIIRAAQKGPDTEEKPHDETAQLPSVVY